MLAEDQGVTGQKGCEIMPDNRQIMRGAYCHNYVLMIAKDLVCPEILQNVIYILGCVEWVSQCLE
jgi:hypothetical protein